MSAPLNTSARPIQHSRLCHFAKLSRYRLTTILLLIHLIVPLIPVPGLAFVPVSYFVVLGLLLAILPQLRWRWNRVDLGFALIILSTVISMVWGTFVKDVPSSPRDAIEIVKIVNYWLLFRLAIYPWHERQVRGFIKWILVGTLVAACIAILQYFDWMGIGRLTLNIYGAGSVHAEKFDAWRRVIGTMKNPNDFAMLMVTGLGITFGAWRWYRPKLMLWTISTASLLAILFTLSRSGFLGLVIVGGVVVFLRILWMRHISKRKWLGQLAILFFLMILFGLPIGVLLPQEVSKLQEMTPVERVSYVRSNQIILLVERYTRSSENSRFLLWQSEIDIVLESPWLGWGPAKTTHERIVDSEYLLYLRRYGLVGIIVYFFLYIRVLSAAYRSLKIHPYDSAKWGLNVSVIAILSAYLAVNVFLTTFYLVQLMSLFWLIFGIGYSTLVFNDHHKG
jgi:O-antigen ligase